MYSKSLLSLRIAPSWRDRIRRNEQRGLLAALVLLGVVPMLNGCGGSVSNQVKAGPIVFTDANGVSAQITSLSIGSHINVSMMPVNDVVKAGVDWSVSCGGNPVTGNITSGCGTLAPAHTAEGAFSAYTAPSAVPIGTTVTLTARVTSNPSQSTSVNVTVLASPIVVGLLVTPPTSLATGAKASFFPLVTNDPSNGGVMWTLTCGSADCGSLSKTTTPSQTSTLYTAPAAVPAGGTVTVTATSVTDMTKSVGFTFAITITPPATPISVNVVPGNIYVQSSGAGQSAKLSAVVLNDALSGGIDWTASCSTSKCGSITAHTASGAAATYTNTSSVPVGGTITLTAKSTTDPTKSATSVATVVSTPPVIISFAGTVPQTINTGTQTSLTAVSSSGTDGINWTITCGAPSSCGSFNIPSAHTASNSPIIYTAPASVPTGNVVTITASSGGTAPANAASVTATIVQGPPSLSFAQTIPSSLVDLSRLPIAVNIVNDGTPGGVTWTAQCASTDPGACGWFSPVQTASGVTTVYTAPPVATTVTLTATSVSNSATKITSSTISITPDTTLAVNFIPALPAQVQVEGSVDLVAAVANDKTHAGVDWQVCSNGCGFFTIRSAVDAIPATATTPYVPSTPAITATSVSAWPSGVPILYTAPIQVPSTNVVGVVATAHADPIKANSGTIAVMPLPSTPALNGTVLAGAQPISNAAVSLYAASTSGYASAATLVASALPSDGAGHFTISANYPCPQTSSQMYLVSVGGSVGTAGANPNRVLMTALGSCADLVSSPIVVNEMTTVASAFALAPFAADDALTGNNSYLYLGTSSTNLVGLKNAFQSVHNLVDISTGNVRYVVPAWNAMVPFVLLNTLADTVNACSTTTGGVEGDGGACSILFTAGDLLKTGTFASSIAPSDTAQAIFNIAQHPVNNNGYSVDNDNGHPLVSLVTSNSPFQPVLSTKPNDYSVSLNYTEGGGLSGVSKVGSFALDIAGNLWLTDAAANTVAEWSSLGAPISPSTGYAAGGGPIAIDQNNNVWISGNGILTELNKFGSPFPWSPYGGVAGGGADLAIDAQGDLWIPTATGVNEFNNLGLELSPSQGFTFTDTTAISTIAVDSSNNVWIGAGSGNSVIGTLAELSNPGAQVIVENQHQGDLYQPQMAADGQGNVWEVRGTISVCITKPYGGQGSTIGQTCYQGGGSANSLLNVWQPRGIAVDGAGTTWVANPGFATSFIPAGVLPMFAGISPLSSRSYAASSLAVGPLRVAIDRSGNIWVLLANNTVTEYVGAAAPTMTPLALGLTQKKLGSRP